MPLTIPSTAWSRAQSSKTMFAALPPSSSVSFLPEPASRRWIALPTSVEPVNAILSTSASTSAAPVRPSPVTMLTTPGGSSACRSTSQKSSAVSGVVSARFRTTGVPHASAGPIFHASISSVDVLLAGLRGLGQRLLGRRRDRRVPVTRARLDELAADEEPVTLLDPDDVAGLRRGRVVPARGDGRAGLPALDLRHEEPARRGR